MTKKNTFLKSAILSLVFIGMLACNGEEKKVEQLKEEVIMIHDEVMPKMDDIMSLKAQLLKIGKSTDSTKLEELAQIQRHIIYLNAADAEMMNWMRTYDPEMEGMVREDKIKYLEKERTSIQLVRQHMLSAIAKSKEFVAKEIVRVEEMDTLQTQPN